MKAPKFLLFCTLLHSYHCQYSNFSNNHKRFKRNFDWCSLNCPQEQHIACKHNADCIVNKPCETRSLDADAMLDAHNKLRQTFANGQAPQSSGITISNMIALNWDWDLAFLAQCNLKLCEDEMKHDQCHITPTFQTAGQNLAWSSGKQESCEDVSKNEFVNDWYNEIKDVDANKIKALAKEFTSSGGPVIRHFTQLVWATTTHVGCAVVKKGPACTLACNYGPAGNMLGASSFKEGPPASECTSSPNKKFPALCGEVISGATGGGGNAGIRGGGGRGISDDRNYDYARSRVRKMIMSELNLLFGFVICLNFIDNI